MSPDNIQYEVEALRAEMPREDAKGELIYKLSTQGKTQKMSILRKASVPTLVTAVAIVGGVMLSQPKVMAATPSRVAAALKKAMNYTIKSFVGEGSSRRMQSVTTIEGEKKTTKYVDLNGNLIDRKTHFETVVGKDGAITVKGSQLGGGLTAIKPGAKISAGKIEVDVKATNGDEKKIIKINGKEVKDLNSLPKELRDRIKISVNDKDVRNVEGAGIVGVARVMPDGAKMHEASAAMMVASLGEKNGKPMILQSGQTPSEYLMDLLADESRWNISRGVSYKGANLDKFVLKMKGSIEPIELYVDPASALPKFLVFKGMDGMGVRIEDVYEYGVQP